MKTVTYKAYEAFLKSLGLEVVRHKGSHEHWNYDSNSKSLVQNLKVRPEKDKKNIPILHLEMNRRTLVLSGVFLNNKEHDDALAKFR